MHFITGIVYVLHRVSRSFEKQKTGGRDRDVENSALDSIGIDTSKPAVHTCNDLKAAVHTRNDGQLNTPQA